MFYSILISLSVVISESVILTIYVPGTILSGIVQRISHLKFAVGVQERFSPIWLLFISITTKVTDVFWLVVIPNFIVFPNPGISVISPTSTIIPSSSVEITSNSVSFSGTFSRISSNLAKIDSTLTGKHGVECYKCNSKIDIFLNQEQKFLVSDGIFSSGDERDDELVIEIQNHIVDFDEILASELESINSDFFTCDICKQNTDYINIEI